MTKLTGKIVKVLKLQNANMGTITDYYALTTDGAVFWEWSYDDNENPEELDWRIVFSSIRDMSEIVKVFKPLVPFL